VLHRKAQVLCRGAFPCVRLGDIVRNAIVLDDAGMINGKVGGALRELRSYWIATILHYVVNEAVHFGERAAGIINKVSLPLAPFRCEALAFRV